MCTTRLFTFVLASQLVPVLYAAPALAAPPTVVWVSKAGADSPTCGAVTAPCKSFMQAHANVAAGGEIGVLTPGDYGSLTVSKSVDITNDGTGEAGIQAAGGLAMFIAAGAGDIVGLRGLVIDGLGTGAAGIQIAQASAVHIQSCVIRNFETSNGPLTFGLQLTPTGNSQLFVSDTLVYNNGSGAATGGINIVPSGSGSANAVLDRVHLENNVRGLWVDGSQSTGNGAHVVVRDSVVSGNAGDGILATSAPGQAPAFIVVERTAAVNNTGTGIRASGPRATMLLHENTVARNLVGISATASGQLISYGNNKVNNNFGPDGTPTGTYGLI